MKKIYILRGVPGSGKSRFAANYRYGEEKKGWICSADQYFSKSGTYKFDPSKLPEAHQSCLRNFIDSISSSCPMIIVDNTNIHAWEMAPYIALGELYGYQVEIHTFKVENPVIAFERNIHNVPLKTIQYMFLALEKEILPRQYQHLNHYHPTLAEMSSLDPNQAS
jgi:predicted ABC-type ATPase